MSRIPRRTWTTILVTGFFSAVAALLTNIGAGSLSFISPLAALLLFAFISTILIALDLWQARLEPATGAPVTVQQQNRQRMLDLVYQKWITEYLEDDLRYDEELLPLTFQRPAEALP